MGTINGKTGLIPENYINFTSGVWSTRYT